MLEVEIDEPPLEAVLDHTRVLQVMTNLYIPRCIVDARHGRVWAESPTSGRTTVYLTLPGADPLAPRSAGD